MSRALSPSSNRSYGVARVIAVWQLARSSYYAARRRQQHPRSASKRGPQRLSDEDLAREIRQVLDQSVFHSEGYRKVWARLRHKGIRAWKDRVLRVMREQQLLSPSRRPDARPTNPHEGSIVAEAPNQLWGTDATATFTEEDGQVTIFAAIDHCSADCIGIHAIKRAHRFEALEPVRQAVREQFGSFSASVAAGVRLRHDHGSVYMSDDFQAEVAFLGMESSPSASGICHLRLFAVDGNFNRKRNAVWIRSRQHSVLADGHCCPEASAINRHNGCRARWIHH